MTRECDTITRYYVNIMETFTVQQHKQQLNIGQESLAIAKMTARCALCIPTSYSP